MLGNASLGVARRHGDDVLDGITQVVPNEVPSGITNPFPNDVSDLRRVRTRLRKAHALAGQLGTTPPTYPRPKYDQNRPKR